MNQFGLVQTVNCFRQGVVITVASAANGRLDACFGQPLAVPDGDVLRATDALLFVKR